MDDRLESGTTSLLIGQSNSKIAAHFGLLHPPPAVPTSDGVPSATLIVSGCDLRIENEVASLGLGSSRKTGAHHRLPAPQILLLENECPHGHLIGGEALQLPINLVQQRRLHLRRYWEDCMLIKSSEKLIL